MKATELLQKQHREIEQLFDRAKTAEDDETIREELAKLLVAHTLIEEEIFYPAVRKAAPDLTLSAIEEHGLADYELGRLLAGKADSDTRDAQIDVLEEIVLLHIRKEEDDLFHTAERALGAEVLAGLAAQMEPRFRELLTAGYKKLLDRAITAHTPHLVAARARATAKKPARRAATPKKAAPKPKRSATTQRARKGRKTQRARTAAAPSRARARAGAA